MQRDVGKSTPWIGTIRLPSTPHCPVCRRPLNAQAWSTMARIATCARRECYGAERARLAHLIAISDTGRYHCIESVTAVWWMPTDPDNDLLTSSMDHKLIHTPTDTGNAFGP